MPGTLYLVSTPIGNAEDMTLRALRILKAVRFIAAEDPRVTKPLMEHHGIDTPLTTYHGGVKEHVTPLILRRLQEGDDVALVVDAGTPAVADPGAYLVAQALASGIPVTSLPGPSAVMAGLPLAAMPCEQFVFFGVFPRQRAARARLLAQLRREWRTAVLFLEGSLREGLQTFGPALGRRRAALVQDVTMPGERVIYGPLHDILPQIDGRRHVQRVTLIIEGKTGSGKRRRSGRKTGKNQTSARRRISTRKASAHRS
jgi:16S rRNA (cytidine1402-2'-O)-methyltransferase